MANQHTRAFTEHSNWLEISLDFRCNDWERETAQILAWKLENIGRFLTERLGVVFDAG